MFESIRNHIQFANKRWYYFAKYLSICDVIVPTGSDVSASQEVNALQFSSAPAAGRTSHLHAFSRALCYVFAPFLCRFLFMVDHSTLRVNFWWINHYVWNSFLLLCVVFCIYALLHVFKVTLHEIAIYIHHISIYLLYMHENVPYVAVHVHVQIFSATGEIQQLIW